jgi:sec-independent protein translocase protein TatA
MGGFSLWHILIFAIIVLLLFGGNRFSNMMKDVAKGLRGFKEGLAEDDKPAEQPRQIPPQQPIDVTPSRPAEPTSTASPPPGEDQSRH